MAGTTWRHGNAAGRRLFPIKCVLWQAVIAERGRIAFRLDAAIGGFAILM